MIDGPAAANVIAAATGSSASSRKSFSVSSTAAPAQTPTHAVRVDDSATASTSAGITSAAHRRSPRPNRIFEMAMPMTSISSPEYVM